MTLPLPAALGDDPDRLLSPVEAAEVLGLRGDRTLRNWARRGVGPRRLRVGAKLVRYRAGDIREWLDRECAA